MIKILLLNIAISCFFLCSCAKKLDKEDDKKGTQGPRNGTIVDPDILNFFKTQSANCEGECHQAVGKLIMFERGKVEFCTATLVAQDVLVTSSNCLGRNLKLPNMSCVNSVFAVFPEMPGLKRAAVMCDKVISSTILEENGDPALWRNDFAFIKLKEPLDRRPVEISREGMTPGESLVAWKMDYLDDRLGALKSDICKPLFNSYANPFAQTSSSPMIPVVDCEFNEGNLGAPLMNSRGELVSLLSSKMDKSLSTYVHDHDIMAEKLAPIQHTSNFACARIPLPGEGDFAPNMDCFKKIDYARLDRYRSRILNSREVHKDNMAVIEKELEAPTNYFKWDVEFYSNKKGNVLEAHLAKPKCFFGIDNWLSEFSRRRWGRLSVFTFGEISVEQKKYILKTKLNRVLKAVSSIEQKESKAYKVEFNPADAYFKSNTTVIVKGELLGSTSNQTFTDVTDACE